MNRFETYFDANYTYYTTQTDKRISSDKASNLPKRDVRFILLKWRLEKLGTLNKYI